MELSGGSNKNISTSLLWDDRGPFTILMQKLGAGRVCVKTATHQLATKNGGTTLIFSTFSALLRKFTAVKIKKNPLSRGPCWGALPRKSFPHHTRLGGTNHKKAIVCLRFPKQVPPRKCAPSVKAKRALPPNKYIQVLSVAWKLRPHEFSVPAPLCCHMLVRPNLACKFIATPTSASF